MDSENLSFGHAIQAWNEHRYPDAYALFEQHMKEFPESPWVAECQLHLGCFCQYNGRLTEAAEWFERVLGETDAKSEMWNKAKLRRSILHLDQGNLEASLKGFREMKRDDLDRNHQSYASYWIREITMLKSQEIALRDCGQKALARVAEIQGSVESATALRELPSAGPHGFTAAELHATALSQGLESRPVNAVSALDGLPVPFVAHYKDHHYVTVREVTENNVKLFDSRSGEVTMPRSSFVKEWSGFALVFGEYSSTAGVFPAENLDSIVGGCCGHPRAPSDLGDDDDCDKNCGMPGWNVNPVNLNFRVGDTPMWWEAPAGPPVMMSLLFNSLDSLNEYESFGEKWSFRYASYLLVTPGTQVQVKDGNGRMQTFTGPADGGSYPITFNSPAGDGRTLVETASHVFTLTHQDGTIFRYGIPPAMSSSNPLLLSIEDRHGNSLNITHNAQGSIVSISHSMLPPVNGVPKLWSLTYNTINGHSRVVRIDDPFGRSAHFSYDNDGNLTGQTDMGGLQYGYEYSTKLSFDSIDPNTGAVMYATQNNPAAPELFICRINTPKGSTNILTEPSDGDSTLSVTPQQVAQGYSVGYPPIGLGKMWTNYRIRITDQEQKTSEYHFDGYNNDSSVGALYYRDPVQLASSVAPFSGGRDRLWFTVVGGVKGKISSRWRYALTGGGFKELYNKTYYSTSLQLKSRLADGSETRYRYHADGSLKSVVLPKDTDTLESDTTTSPYRIHLTKDSVNTSDLDKIQRYLDGNLRTLLDVDYFAGSRNIQKTTDALGHATIYAWHSNGLIQSATDQFTGDVTTFVYDQGSDDADGYPTWRLLKVKVNGTTVRDVEYDSVGRPEVLKDSYGDFKNLTYDGLNRLTRIDGSDDSFVQRIWECCYLSEERSGAVVGGQDRVRSRAKYIHDHRGLRLQSTDSAGRVVQVGYDDLGRMTSLTDAMGRVTTWTFDEYGRPDKKYYPGGTYEQLVWDGSKFGIPEKFRNRAGRYHAVRFDEHGNLTRLFLEETVRDVDITRAYDAWDRLDTIKDVAYSTNVHDFDHDLAGRVTKIDGPWTSDVMEWDYNAPGTVMFVQPGQNNIGLPSSTSYDALGRISGFGNGLGSFTMGYDAETSRPLSITHSGGFNTTFAYLGADQGRALHTLTSKLPSGSVIGKHTYGYDDQGRVSSWKREAVMGASGYTPASYQWATGYDFASQLTSVSEKSLAGALEGSWDYGYDAAGNMSSVQTATDASQPALITRRGHNALNQIDSWGGAGPTTVRGTLNEPAQASVGLAGGGMKPARMLEGNRFEAELALQPGEQTFRVSATDGSGNTSNYSYRVNTTAAGARSFTYDTCGNLLSDGVRSYTWDSLSRLTRVVYSSGQALLFKYNALGQRCEEITESYGVPVSTKRYLYDGIRPVCRYSGTGTDGANIDRRYYPQGEMRKNGSSWDGFLYCRDHLGSVREVVKSDGTLAARYDYDPYGKRTAQYVSTSYSGGCEFGFTGHRTAVAGGDMVLTHFRAYDPELGRWLSADPLGEAGGLNLYGYVGGDPMNFLDPNGLWKMDWERAGIGLLKGFTVGVVVGVAIAAAPVSLAVVASGALIAYSGYQAAKIVDSWDCMSDGDKSELTGNIVGGVLGGGAGVRSVSAFKGGYAEGAFRAQPGSYRPNSPLPRDKYGRMLPDPDATGAHTQIGTKAGSKGDYTQAREFDGNGQPVRDVDFTDHGRPNQGHDNPHQHRWVPNANGGTPKRGSAESCE